MGTYKQLNLNQQQNRPNKFKVVLAVIFNICFRYHKFKKGFKPIQLNLMTDVQIDKNNISEIAMSKGDATHKIMKNG